VVLGAWDVSQVACLMARDVIVTMLELGTVRDEIADRLGIPTRDVKRAAPVASPITGERESEEVGV
jgi:hypothetical protein